MNNFEELNTILKNFTDKLVDINNYQSFIKNSTKRSLEFYYDQLEKQKAFNIEDLTDFNSLSSWNIKDDSRISIGHTKNTLDDLIEITQLQNNKQYQNLLVDAYESFLKYLDELYVYLCIKDNSFWSNKISDIDISNKNFESLLKIIKNKNNRKEIICFKLKEHISTIELLEKKNPKNIDYVFEMNLIEQLRHWIVHNRGVIEEVDKLIKKIIPDITSLKKDTQQHLRAQVFYYVGEVSSENFVLLLEFDHKENHKFSRRYNDRLGELISKLVSYAILLKDLSVWYLSDNENLKILASNSEEYKKFFASSDLYKYLR